jgi:hypothetical protein
MLTSLRPGHDGRMQRECLAGILKKKESGLFIFRMKTGILWNIPVRSCAGEGKELKTEAR